MVDGPWLRALKFVVRLAWVAEWAIRRGVDPGPWRLAGECRRCAACCEAPAIHVGPFTWAWPRPFLAWQRRVNGFHLLDKDAETLTFRFRCAHFDPVTRACDSYASRPFLCRDYPRGLLAQAWPDLFDRCGHRVVLRNGKGMADAIDRTGLSTVERAALKRKMRVE